MRALALLLAASLCAAPACAGERLRVVTPSGPVSGVRGDGFDSFKGIPYAAPPVGALRWRKPQPPPKWTADLDAADFGPSCMQPTPPRFVPPDSPAFQRSEDCLRLNIWAPPGAKKAPVMVWLHGGGNEEGSPADFFMDGQNIAKDGVILVSVNYRLGLLGFFAWPGLSEDGKDAANFGLWDQVAALKWVKANIEAFGGDPQNITLAGESSGGEDTLILLASPAAHGLFEKAIVESGGGGWGPMTEISDAQKTIAAKLGGKTLADLRAMPATDLAQIGGHMDTPLVDHDLLPETPLRAFADGSAAKVPLVIGTNNGEGSLLGRGPIDPATVWNKLSSADLASLRADYGGEAGDDTAFARLLFRDGYLTGPARFIARHADGYLYRFSYVPAILASRRSDAWHGAEVPFVFERIFREADFDAADRAVEAAIHGDWIAFARSGEPGWRSFNASGQEMRFDAHPSPRAPDDAKVLDLLESRLSPLE